MINFDEYTNKNKTENNPNYSHIPDNRRLRIWKTNALLHLIDNHLDIDKICLYAKDPYKDKYQFLVKKRGSIGFKHFNDPKAFIEYSNDMNDVTKILMIKILIKKIKY